MLKKHLSTGRGPTVWCFRRYGSAVIVCIDVVIDVVIVCIDDDINADNDDINADNDDIDADNDCRLAGDQHQQPRPLPSEAPYRRSTDR